MNQAPGSGYPGQQTGQPAYMTQQQQQQPYSLPQTPTSASSAAAYGQQQQQQQQQMASGQYQHSPGAQLAYGSMAPPPPQQGQQGQPQQQQLPPRSGSQPNGNSAGGGGVGGGGKLQMLPPEQVSKSVDGKTYKLEVVQEPVRARMCGFGDKDRRPITPPPCVRLVIIDDKTGQECEPSEFDVNFFILTVDLWDESGHKEVNLVRHSATSPSISAATSSSYPPPSAPVYPYSANTAATANAHSVAAAQATGMQVHVGMTNPGYGPTQFGAHHSAPYMSQPPGGSPQSAAAPMTQYAPSPVHDGGPRSRDEAQSYYVSPQGQATGPTVGFHGGAAPGPQYGMPAGYPQNMSMLTPPHAPPMDPRSAPSGMFTRNLIGSLAVNGNPLTDPTGKAGIWFILQDLSVRTEGVFRLKMQFCCISDPAQKNTLNRGSAPILASTFSSPFQVYSAKKFPGVIESTPLSKCFAMQGVKIPIRKDGPTGKAAEVDDDAQD